jgi:hypothetical protein
MAADGEARADTRHRQQAGDRDERERPASPPGSVAVVRRGAELLSDHEADARK